MKQAYKLLLLQPPVQDFYDTAIRLQPIGLCYLKAAVQQFLPEFEVIVKDYHQGWGRRTIPLPPELAYLKQYYAYPDKSPFCSFYQYYHFGASFEEMARDVAQEQPDIVGISSLFSPYYREVIQCARAIKERLALPVLAGGSHVSADPERMLRHDCIDFVIRGEGERALVEFLRAWKSGADYKQVPNLGFKDDGHMVLNPIAPNYPIDELPKPDFSDVPPQRYLFEQRPLYFLITSRGCPHHCSFCSVHLTFGTTYRRRSTELILQEIEQRYEEGYRVFDFEDDNLTFDREAVKQLCQEIIRRFPDGALQLLAMNGLSYHSLDQELLLLMKRAGFTHLNLSVVSADRTTRQKTLRPHSLEQYFNIVRAGAEAGFHIVSYQIFGLPQESLESMIQTLVLNTGLPVLLGASIFYLTPHSPIASAFPVFTEEDMVRSRLTAMAIETSFVTRDELFTLFLTSRIINFLKGIDFPGNTITFTEALEQIERQGGRTALGGTILRRLFDERILYAAAGKQFLPIQRFQPDMFFRIWSRLENICTQKGKIIFSCKLREFWRSERPQTSYSFSEI